MIRRWWRAFWKWIFDLFRPKKRVPRSMSVRFGKPTKEK